MSHQNNANAYSIPVQNYTQMPNVIFDHWQAILSPSQFSVLLCICRKTFGWHKFEDNISCKQIEAKTGLSKHTILSAIDKLIEYNLIIKIKSKTSDGDDAPNRFLINVSDELPKTQNLGGGSAEIALGVVQNLHQGVVQNLHPQKKDPTKEKITKGETTSLPQNRASSLPADNKVRMYFDKELCEWKGISEEQIPVSIRYSPDRRHHEGTASRLSICSIRKRWWTH